MWKKQGETIAIEHEIRDEGIFEKEIPNLMSVKAHLRVLITYVRDYVNFVDHLRHMIKMVRYAHHTH